MENQKQKKIGDDMSNLEVFETLFYPHDEGEEKVEVIIEDETLWATQKSIANLFDVDRSVITKHFRNIFNEGELDKSSVCAKFAQAQIEGDRKIKSIES